MLAVLAAGACVDGARELPSAAIVDQPRESEEPPPLPELEPEPEPAPVTSCSVRETLQIGEGEEAGEISVLDDGSVFFSAGMAIDADGSPRAYHPRSSVGLDYLENAGRPGHWWALVVDPDGAPVVQGEGDPAPGYYVSMTALEDRGKAETDPHRYVDAERIPYVVLPAKARTEIGIWLGDLALVVDPESGKQAFALFADIGPNGHLGEGSIALAKALGIPSNPRRGGTDRKLTWLVWPGTGDHHPHDDAWIKAQGRAAFEAWGGQARLERCQLGSSSNPPDSPSTN